FTNANAATITSTASGLFSATGTWVGGVVPVAGDDIVIANGHNVDFDLGSAVVFASLKLGAASTLTLSADGMTVTTISANAAGDDFTIDLDAFTLTSSGGLSIGAGAEVVTLASTAGGGELAGDITVTGANGISELAITGDLTAGDIAVTPGGNALTFDIDESCTVGSVTMGAAGAGAFTLDVLTAKVFTTDEWVVLDNVITVNNDGTLTVSTPASEKITFAGGGITASGAGSNGFTFGGPIVTDGTDKDITFTGVAAQSVVVDSMTILNSDSLVLVTATSILDVSGPIVLGAGVDSVGIIIQANHTLNGTVTLNNEAVINIIDAAVLTLGDEIQVGAYVLDVTNADGSTAGTGLTGGTIYIDDTGKLTTQIHNGAARALTIASDINLVGDAATADITLAVGENYDLIISGDIISSGTNGTDDVDFILNANSATGNTLVFSGEILLGVDLTFTVTQATSGDIYSFTNVEATDDATLTLGQATTMGSVTTIGSGTATTKYLTLGGAQVLTLGAAGQATDGNFIIGGTAGIAIDGNEFTITAGDSLIVTSSMVNVIASAAADTLKIAGKLSWQNAAATPEAAVAIYLQDGGTLEVLDVAADLSAASSFGIDSVGTTQSATIDLRGVTATTTLLTDDFTIGAADAQTLILTTAGTYACSLLTDAITLGIEDAGNFTVNGGGSGDIGVANITFNTGGTNSVATVGAILSANKDFILYDLVMTESGTININGGNLTLFRDFILPTTKTMTLGGFG
ncbi:beta strand repeat-containing protein, partial [candidate division KSB1 bacterium]